MSDPVTTIAPATTAPAPAGPARRRRPYLLLLLTALGLGLLSVGAYGLWLKYTTHEPPAVRLDDLDPEIVEAVTTARQRVQQMPRLPEEWGRLGAVLRAHEFLVESNICFAEAQRLSPNDFRWPYLIALEALDRDREAALPHLRRAVEICGDHPVPRLRLGEVLLDRGDVSEAEALFQEALEKDRDPGRNDKVKQLMEARAHLGLGRAALERNDVAAALDHLRRAAEGAPRAKVVHAALLQAFQRYGDEKGSQEELRILSSLPEGWTWPDPGLLYVNQCWVGLRARMARITVLDQQGEREEAVVAARQAARRYPDSPLAHLVLGEMLNKARNCTAAEPAIREAVRLGAKGAKVHFELAYALDGQGKVAAACDSYRQAIELQPEYAVAHFNLGLCLQRLKKEAEAQEEMRAAIRCRPSYVDALMALAIMLARQGKQAEAVQQVEEAIRVAPADKRPRELLDEIRTRASKPDKP
jgi:tetratricopeptide (TPR) repeat protein